MATSAADLASVASVGADRPNCPACGTTIGIDTGPMVSFARCVRFWLVWHESLGWPAFLSASRCCPCSRIRCVGTTCGSLVSLSLMCDDRFAAQGLRAAIMFGSSVWRPRGALSVVCRRVNGSWPLDDLGSAHGLYCVEWLEQRAPAAQRQHR